MKESMASLNDIQVAKRWELIHSSKFHDLAGEIIRNKTPQDTAISRITHMRTAHYAVYRVTAATPQSWVVRIGALDEENHHRSPDNSGYLSTSVYQPVGQAREAGLAEAFSYYGAKVCVPELYYHDEKIMMSFGYPS